MVASHLRGDVPLGPWNFQELLRSLAQSSQNKTDFDIFGWQFPVSLVYTKIFNQLISFLENDTQLPDLDTISQGKLLENHTLHSGHMPI